MQVLKQCGNDLTRENVMKQAASLKDFDSRHVLPGIKINTSADRLRADRAGATDAFDGKTWVRFGEVIGAESK